MQRFTALPVVVSLLLAVSPRASRAAEVLQNVPPDALGFVVAREIGPLDGKVQRLLANLQLKLGGPLAFLQAATGIGEGLDSKGDLLVAVLPDESGGDRPKLCLWLPIADYGRFVASLGSKPEAGITAVTVAGVDLLVAKQGQWALVMDPDERDRMERLLATQPAPPKQAHLWRQWIESNDATVVALVDGAHELLTLAASAPGDVEGAEPAENADDDIFGVPDENNVVPENPGGPNRAANDLGSNVRDSIRAVLESSPKTLQWAHAVKAIGFGVRLDNDGNLLGGVRVVWDKDSNFAPGSGGTQGSLPPSIFDGGEFIVHGVGHLPQPLTGVIAGAYVRLLVDDLKKEMSLALDSETVARFQDAVEQAAATVPAAGVLTLAGEKHDGVYTNSFLVVRVDSAAAFVDHANEVMRLWNQMNREADEGTRLVFDVGEVPMGGRTATHYTIDIAAADGAAVIPEIRQAMEKLFGPGGKMRLIVAPADDHSVLLAMATPEQVERALKTLHQNQSNWEGGESVDPTARLLPPQGDWRVFFSPHGYNRWLSRQMDAITGPVFGGPLVKEFPASAPVGVVGGAKDYELWIEAAVPAETVQSAGTYIKNKRGQVPH